MTWRQAIAAALLATLVSPAAGVDRLDWRASLPANWLAVAVVESPAASASHVDELLQPWGLKTDWLHKRITAFFPELLFADRPWALALVEKQDGSLAPLLLAPTDNFAALCESLDADIADEIAVAAAGGFDLALIDRDGWVQVTLLDSTPTIEDPAAENAAEDQASDDEIAVLDRLGDCNARVAVSQRGLDQLAEVLTARRKGQLQSGRGRIPRWAWPNGFAAAVERLAPYAPVAQQLAGTDRPLAVGFRRNSREAWVASLVLPIEAKPATQIPPTLPPGGEPIATIYLASALSNDLIDLAIAGEQCRPDEIDAPEYPQPQWDDLAEAYRQLLRGYRAASGAMMLPGRDEPVATNHVGVFTWEGGAEQLGETLALTVVRWNQVVDAAKSRTPLRLSIEPLKASAGWRLSTDLFAGFAVERSPEVESLFERYYGGDTLSVDVKATGADTWQIAMGPSSESAKAATEEADAPSSTEFPLTGTVWIDRWFAWQQQVEDITMGDAIGYRMRPPMAKSPPATFKITAAKSLRLDATLPATTYKAAVDYWRADKVKPSRKLDLSERH